MLFEIRFVHFVIIIVIISVVQYSKESALIDNWSTSIWGGKINRASRHDFLSLSIFS